MFFGSDNCLFKLDPSGTLTRVAGTSRAGYSGDGGPAINAQLGFTGGEFPGIAVDSAGNVYIADFFNDRIRKVSSAGIITTVAGNGSLGTSGDVGDGGAATDAQLDQPRGVVVDSVGNIYVGSDSRVRKISPAGIITTIAGTGIPGYSGDGGPAINAQISEAAGLALDNSGNLYIADRTNHRVRQISSVGIITTIAGTGIPGYSGDGGAATGAQLNAPQSVAVDHAGNLYLTDVNFDRIRKVSFAGIITTVAGNGTSTLYSGGRRLGYQRGFLSYRYSIGCHG